MRNPIFKHAQIVKFQRLMNMMYKPSEIADEIGVTYDTVKRSYVPAGCPVTRDESGRMWINGHAFAKWANELHKERKPKRAKLKENQAYCFHCREVVTFKPKASRPINRWLEMVSGTCDKCKGNVNKARGIQRK